MGKSFWKCSCFLFIVGIGAVFTWKFKDLKNTAEVCNGNVPWFGRELMWDVAVVGVSKTRKTVVKRMTRLFPSAQPLWGIFGMLCSGLVFPMKRRHGYWSRSSEGQKDSKEIEASFMRGRGCKSQACSAWRRECSGSYCQCVLKPGEGGKKIGLVPNGGWEG